MRCEFQAGGFEISALSLREIFITHHHSDHNAEVRLLLNNAWATGLRTPVDAYGPAGINALAQGFWDAKKFDIETRIADEGRPDLRKLATIHDYSEGQARIANSAALVECPSNGLQRLSCLSGHLLGKVREILCLFGQPFDLLAHVRGRQLEKLWQRRDASQLTGKVKGCVHVRLGDVKEMEIKICGTF